MPLSRATGAGRAGPQVTPRNDSSEILGPRPATRQDVILWIGLLLVALAGGGALFGGTVRDLLGSSSTATTAPASP